MNSRQIWTLAFRAFRLANRADLMTDDGFAIRMQATSDMRQFTGLWDLPTPLCHWEQNKARGSRSFRLFVKGH